MTRNGAAMRFMLVLLFAVFPLAGLACGESIQCRVGDRYYHIAMPPGHDGRSPVPAAIFAHGLQGSALGIIRNPRLRAVAAQHGFALIAVKSRGDDWSIPGSPEAGPDQGLNELTYFDAVIADVTSRFPVDETRIVMSGASVGGMVTWYLACNRSDLFAAFVPMSGTYWGAPPDRCTRPVTSIIHFHGDNDRTVPLEGRVARGRQQGSVTEALSHYATFGRFRDTGRVTVGDMSCDTARNWRSKLLNFCLYPGRHAFRSANLGIAWRMLQAAGQL